MKRIILNDIGHDVKRTTNLLHIGHATGTLLFDSRTEIERQLFMDGAI